jgi:hypothetical protein
MFLHDINTLLQCTGCGSSCCILTDVVGTFTDGSGSSDYPNNADCSWIIAPNGAWMVSITFTDFSSESSYDYVNVWKCTDSSCSYGQQLGTLTGSYSTKQSFTSSTGYIYVYFHSDSSVVYPGFSAKWVSLDSPAFHHSLLTHCADLAYINQIPSVTWLLSQSGFVCSGCGSSCGLLTSSSGTFTDGSDSSYYPNDADCDWIIAPSDVQPITITFTEFNTESGYDFVKIWACSDSSCMYGQQLASLSGSYYSSQSFTSYTGYMYIYFYSDSSEVQSGFRATWVRTFLAHQGACYDSRISKSVTVRICCV